MYVVGTQMNYFTVFLIQVMLWKLIGSFTPPTNIHNLTQTGWCVIKCSSSSTHEILVYSKTCVKLPFSKRPKIGFQDQLSLIAGQKYCRMLQGEHSVILLTFIKLPIVIKIFVLSSFEWRFNAGFTVVSYLSATYHVQPNKRIVRLTFYPLLKMVWNEMSSPPVCR